MFTDKIRENTETQPTQNSNTDFLPAYTAGLTAEALTIGQPIVSHTTDSYANIESILIKGIKSKSHPDNLMGGNAFYVAQSGYSIHEVDGKYTMTFRVPKDFRVLDAREAPWGTMKGTELVKAAKAAGYEGVLFEGSYRIGQKL